MFRRETSSLPNIKGSQRVLKAFGNKTGPYDAIAKYVAEAAKHGGNNNMLNSYPSEVPKRIRDIQSSSDEEDEEDAEQNGDDDLTEEERAVVLEMRQITQEIDQNET